jgi:hypothetical protein
MMSKSSETWSKLNRIIRDNPEGGILLDKFYKVVRNLQKHEQNAVGQEEHENFLNDNLKKVNEDLSILGHKTTLKQIEKIAIMSQLGKDRT